MYLRKSKKYSNDTSIYDEIATDFDGNVLTFIDFLPNPKGEESIYSYETTEYSSIVLSISLNSLSTRKLLVVLYFLSGMSQREIGKHLSISQSYASRIISSFQKDSRKIRKYSDEILKLKYHISQYNDLDFIFSIDDRRKLCLSIHSKFFNAFIAFWKTHNTEFETVGDTGRIIIRLTLDESSYLFCANLIQYISENIQD